MNCVTILYVAELKNGRSHLRKDVRLGGTFRTFGTFREIAANVLFVSALESCEGLNDAVQMILLHFVV